MNLIDRTLKDSAWYWAPAQATGADGVPVFTSAVLLQPPTGGRWDDNPVMAVGPQGEQFQINARFTTRQAIVAGGWLLQFGSEGGNDPASQPPNAFPLSREIFNVVTVKTLSRKTTYFTGVMK